MPELQLKERQQESRRVDYASLSYQVGSREALQEAFDGVVSVTENLCGGFPFEDTHKGTAFFDRLFINDLGIRIEMTEPGSGLRNAGLMLLTLPGKAFYLQSSGEQAWMLHQLMAVRGYRWLTRIDLQNTELEPRFSADHVMSGVLDNKLWVKGYGSWRPGGDMDFDHHSPKGASIYWGSKRSERQARTYDKSKESDWRDLAIRDELQLRGEWAKAYGRELRQGLLAAHGTDDMANFVSSLVVSGLTNHLQYMNLNGTNPKADKNWTRKAEPADWFVERIGKPQKLIRKAQAPEKDLEASVSWGIRQYGKIFGEWMLARQEVTGDSLADITQQLGLRFFAKLPDDCGLPKEFLDGCRNYEALGAEELWNLTRGDAPRN